MEERRVSTVDRGILELKTAIMNMHAQIESLHSKMDEWVHLIVVEVASDQVRYTRKASEAIRLKRKAIALNYLRSRKLLEDLNNKRLTSLTTLESTLISVEAAAGDIEVWYRLVKDKCYWHIYQQIMRMYESSTATLRAILAHPSLKRESIDETLDALAEANADAKEIDDAVRIGADVALNTNEVDDEELETELNKLIEEATLEHRTVEERLADAKMKVPRESLPGGAVEDGRAIVPSLA
jgi:charged multivesicular body protein 7